jgi:uncharacterized membrane protein YhfC
MQVSQFSMFFMVVSIVLSIGVPLFLFVFFALILERSIHSVVLTSFNLKENPLAYVLYSIFMAGVFEETARFVSFKIINAKYSEPVAKVGYFCTGSCSFSG